MSHFELKGSKVHFFGVFIAPKVSKWGSGPRRLPTYVCNDYSAPADSADALLKVGAHLMDKPLAVEGDTPNVPTGGLNDHLGTGCRGSAPAWSRDDER